ncbi:MAG: aldehyde dehydrogenase family protein [Chitinophagaceae bacterium]
MYKNLTHLQHTFFAAGHTRSYDFRIAQLKKLQQALQENEQAIFNALEKDLGKSNLEAYVSELGQVLTELSLHIKKLKRWMRPHRVRTNLVSQPSSTKMYYDPLGVVLIIAPWNYPFQLLMSPLVGAISGGNCAVLKPSELTPATESIIEKIITENFDPAYIAVVKGDGAEVVPDLMNNFRFDHVLFTGSIPVGKAVYELAAKQLVPVTLELGGKSPTIICADANLTTAAQRITFGKWLNAGQTCIAPDYVLVEETVKTPFIIAMKKAISTFYADASNSNDYGKIVNEKRFDKLVSYLACGQIIEGGNYDKARLFIAPTLMDNVASDAPIMTEEIFGPILPIITFTTKEAAFKIVAENSHPLAFYLFTNNKETEKWWMQRVPFGGGCVNNTVFHFANDHIPFGGIGNSGIGGYHGKYSFYTFTHAKPVLKTPTWFEPKFKYPPYGKGSMKLFKWMIR